MFYGFGSAERIKQARALKARIKKLIQDELEEGMDPWWFIGFHYNDGKTNEDQVIEDVGDLKISLEEKFIREETEALRVQDHFLIPRC